jgi:hypothetical protein
MYMGIELSLFHVSMGILDCNTQQTGYCIFSILLYNVNVHVVIGGFSALLYNSGDIEAAFRF